MQGGFLSLRRQIREGEGQIHFCKEDELTGAVLNDGKNHKQSFMSG